MAGLARGGRRRAPPLTGPVFDSAALMVEAALAGHGVALGPAGLFEGVPGGAALRGRGEPRRLLADQAQIEAADAGDGGVRGAGYWTCSGN